MNIENPIAYLSTVLKMPLHVPDAPATSLHQIGFSGQPRYTESVKVVKRMQEKAKKEGLTPHQQIILKAMQSRKTPFSAREMSQKTGFSKCYCNLVMCTFWKQGIATRVKERVALTKQYVYSLKA